MTNIPPGAAMGFIDNPQAPDVFADSLTGFFLLNGNIRLTFESARVNHTASPGPVNRVVIGRLIMPVDAAENMAKEILRFIQNMRENPTPTAQASPTLQ